MSLRKLSEVLEVLKKDDLDDQGRLLYAVSKGDSLLTTLYQQRCNVRDVIIDMLEAVDEL